VRGAAGILLVALGLAAAGCGGSSGDSQLTPSDVQRYVLAREAGDNLSRLIVFISTADSTINRLAAAKPGSPSARSLARGADLGWNNVVVELNNFNTQEAAAIPGLTALVQNYRILATNWQAKVEAIAQHGGRSAGRTSLADALQANRHQELKVRPLLTRFARSDAQVICQLERAHQELAPPGDAARACADSAQLGASADG
jgi:hypothetical protein